MTPSAVVAAQAAAWSLGDLEGYLEHLHPEVVYQHGTLVLSGLNALREHYRGKVSGRLEVQVQEERVRGATTVLVVHASLGTWTGIALLTFVQENGAWLIIEDATIQIS